MADIQPREGNKESGLSIVFSLSRFSSSRFHLPPLRLFAPPLTFTIFFLPTVISNLFSFSPLVFLPREVVGQEHTGGQRLEPKNGENLWEGEIVSSGLDSSGERGRKEGKKRVERETIRLRAEGRTKKPTAHSVCPTIRLEGGNLKGFCTAESRSKRVKTF